MNKQAQIEFVMTKLNLSKKDAEKFVVEFFEEMEKALVEGKEITLGKIAKLIVKVVAERECLVNPKQKELGKKIVPAHKAIKLKVGKYGKELV